MNLNLSEMSYAEKKKTAKELGLNVPLRTKGHELDRMIREALPTANEGPKEAQAESTGRGEESLDFPGPPEKPRAMSSQAPAIRKRDELHKRQMNLWEAAKKYYADVAEEPYPAKPRAPKLKEGETKEDKSYQDRHWLYKQAKQWWYTVDVVKVTLTKPVGLGGRKIGPGKNIPVTRCQRDEINRHFSRKKTLDMKLLTGNFGSSYFDSIMNPAVAEEVH